MSIPTFADSALDGIPNATPQQYADARAYVERHAPDCADVIFGLHATREADQRVRLERGLRGGLA